MAIARIVDMKVLTWNIRRAGAARKGLWDVLWREAPEIALLQELSGLPEWVPDRYHVHQVKPRYFSGRRAPFANAVLCRWPLDTAPFLRSHLDWVNDIHRERDGWLLECRTRLDDGARIRLVSVHSPAFPIPAETLKNVDIAPIKLDRNPDLWFTEVLWSLLGSRTNVNGENWIVAGDFNSSLLFDRPVDRCNWQIAKRMNELGLTDCLSQSRGQPVATFRHSGGTARHQIDYCYVNRPLLDRLNRVRVLDRADVFDRADPLSDHLPIICEFD